MINKEVERRVAGYCIARTMTEDEYNLVVDKLAEAIWESGETISDEELVRLGVKLINQIVESRKRQ